MKNNERKSLCWESQKCFPYVKQCIFFEGDGGGIVAVSDPTESYIALQLCVDMWFNARRRLFVTVFCIVRFPLFDVESTVHPERMVVKEDP
jgi:hypothetical protein